MCGCGGVACPAGWVCTTKTPNRNDLKLGTVVALDTLSQPTDFGFKRAMGGLKVMVRFRVRQSAPICISRERMYLLVIIIIIIILYHR